MLAGLADRAAAQTFGLDDLPAGPITPGAPVGVIPGFGAEDPYGLVGPPLAPSPSLGFLGPLGDGAWLSPGPVVQHPGPNGFYIDAFSRDHFDTGQPIMLEFSVDRVTFGMPGTGVGMQAALGQAHGDVFTSTHSYFAPGGFAGAIGPPPFGGVLAAIAGGLPGNVLTTDDSFFGLLTPLGVVGPGVAVPPPIVSPALHDNLESFDDLATFDANGDSLFDVDTYFTLYPDEAFAVGLTPADIVVVAAGDPGAIAVAYAPAPLMGLFPDADSIDALVVYDNGLPPLPLSNPAAPGFIEPIIDYALFSLAPGSASLAMWGLDAGDILFTDFTGTFAVYAPTPSIGLIPLPPGFPFQTDNVDALDVTHPCPPPTPATVFLYNGTGINLDTLAASKVLVGGTWTATLTPQLVRGPGPWVILLRSAAAAGPIVDLGLILGLPPAGLSEILVGLLAFIADFNPPPHAGFGIPTTFAASVPLNCGLIGNSWFAQAVVLGNLPLGLGLFDPWFSSAAGGVIGTF